MRARRPGLLAIAGASLVLMAACAAQPTASTSTTTTTEQTAPDGLSGEALTAWNTWQSQGIDDYHYSLSIGCECQTVDQADIAVSNNSVTSISASPAERTMIGSVFRQSPTVEGLFAWIATAQKQADKVELTFDNVTGVPTAVNVDYVSNAIDDEVAVTTQRFGTDSPTVSG